MLNEVLFTGSTMSYNPAAQTYRIRNNNAHQKNNAVIYTGRELELGDIKFNNVERLGKLNLFA